MNFIVEFALFQNSEFSMKLTHGSKLVFELLLKSCFFPLKSVKATKCGSENLVTRVIEKESFKTAVHINYQHEFFLWGIFFQTFFVTWWIVNKKSCLQEGTDWNCYELREGTQKQASLVSWIQVTFPHLFPELLFLEREFCKMSFSIRKWIMMCFLCNWSYFSTRLVVLLGGWTPSSNLLLISASYYIESAQNLKFKEAEISGLIFWSILRAFESQNHLR